MRQSLVPKAIWPIGLLAVTSFVVSPLFSSRAMPKPAGVLAEDKQDDEEEEAKLPPALARRMERLKSLPGADGESPEGRFAADAEKFLSLAYPGDDIPLANMRGLCATAGRRSCCCLAR